MEMDSFNRNLHYLKNRSYSIFHTRALNSIAIFIPFVPNISKSGVPERKNSFNFLTIACVEIPAV